MFLDHPGMLEDSCLLHTATVEVVQVHGMCHGVRRAVRSVSGGYTRPVCRSMWCAVLCSAYLQRSVSGVSARACQPGTGGCCAIAWQQAHAACRMRHMGTAVLLLPLYVIVPGLAAVMREQPFCAARVGVCVNGFPCHVHHPKQHPTIASGLHLTASKPQAQLFGCQDNRQPWSVTCRELRMLQEASATSPSPHPQPTNMELITTSASKPASTTLPLPGAQKLQVHDADDAKLLTCC